MTGPLQRGPLVTIANGASLSNAIDIADLGLVGIQMPTAWTAASITFQAAETPNGTFQDVYDSTGTELSITVDASRYVTLSPITFAGLRWVKFRSGTTGAPVTQGGARNLVPMVRKLA